MKVDKRRKVAPETVKKLQELRGKGMTYQAISKKIGLSYLTVYKYLNTDKKAEDKVEIKKEEQVGDKKIGFFGRLKKNWECNLLAIIPHKSTAGIQIRAKYNKTIVGML